MTKPDLTVLLGSKARQTIPHRSIIHSGAEINNTNNKNKAGPHTIHKLVHQAGMQLRNIPKQMVTSLKEEVEKSGSEAKLTVDLP